MPSNGGAPASVRHARSDRAAPLQTSLPGCSGRRGSSAGTDGLMGARCLLVMGVSYRFDGMAGHHT